MQGAVKAGGEKPRIQNIPGPTSLGRIVRGTWRRSCVLGMGKPAQPAVSLVQLSPEHSGGLRMGQEGGGTGNPSQWGTGLLDRTISNCGGACEQSRKCSTT